MFFHGLKFQNLSGKLMYAFWNFREAANILIVTAKALVNQSFIHSGLFSSEQAINSTLNK